MTDEDRESIYNEVVKVQNEKVIITHGTDTIHITAKKLMDIKNKVIILTGAMLPEKFSQSDADFNLGMAVASVQTLRNGVYICLYGVVTKAEEFVKK